MTEDLIKSLRAFSDENADAVKLAEDITSSLRTFVERMAAKAVPPLTAEGAIRQNFIAQVCAAQTMAIQGITEALLSAAVSVSEQRRAARRIDRVHVSNKLTPPSAKD